MDWGKNNCEYYTKPEIDDFVDVNCADFEYPYSILPDLQNDWVPNKIWFGNNSANDKFLTFYFFMDIVCNHFYTTVPGFGGVHAWPCGLWHLYSRRKCGPATFHNQPAR